MSIHEEQGRLYRIFMRQQTPVTLMECLNYRNLDNLVRCSFIVAKTSYLLILSVVIVPGREILIPEIRFSICII